MKCECWLGKIKFLLSRYLLEDFQWQNVLRMFTFTSQPKDSEARCFGLMPDCYIYLRLRQNPSEGTSNVAAVAYSARRHLELCGELLGKILKSPTHALLCLKLFQPAFVSLFASVPSKDLE